MAWNLRVNMTETCSCNMFCPCWFGNQEYMVMDQGWCGGALHFQIEEGQSDGVDLSGRTVATAVFFPGPTLFDGQATARVYIDDEATDEQFEKLVSIFQGQQGGPMAIFGSFVSTWLPTEKTSIDSSTADGTLRATVGSFGKIQSQPMLDAEGNGFTLSGGGFVGGFGLEKVELAPGAGTTWSDPQLPQSFESKSGARGVAVWSG